MSLSEIVAAVQPHLPVIAWAVALLIGVGALAANNQLNIFLRETVAAVYRVAIKAASDLGDEGLRWLRSEEGIAFRRDLAARAYDAIPSALGPVPVGVIKLLVSRDQFAGLVENAFEEIVALADKLELEKEAEKLADRLFME